MTKIPLSTTCDPKHITYCPGPIWARCSSPPLVGSFPSPRLSPTGSRRGTILGLDHCSLPWMVSSNIVRLPPFCLPSQFYFPLVGDWKSTYEWQHLLSLEIVTFIRHLIRREPSPRLRAKSPYKHRWRVADWGAPKVYLPPTVAHWPPPFALPTSRCRLLPTFCLSTPSHEMRKVFSALCFLC